MRIRDRGGSGGGKGGDPLHQGREQRARSFRSTHRVGQQVTGRFLKRDPSGLAWVSFDGLPLLARIEADPPPGSTLRFTIQALTPDIVLKECRGKAGGRGQGNAQIVVGFDTVRTAFEDAAREAILAAGRSEMRLDRRRDALLASLDPARLALYTRTALAQAAVNAALAATGPTRLFYLPWLAPALKLDLVLRSEHKDDGRQYHEAALGFDSPDLGPGHIRILARSGRSAVRVFLDTPAHLPVARAVLSVLGCNLEAATTILGAVRPPQYARGGVLQQLLASSPHALIGLGG